MATLEVEVGAIVEVAIASRVSMGTSVGVEKLDVGVTSSSVGRGVGGVPCMGRLQETSPSTTKTIHR
jgi:hypothetical protein